MIQVFPDSGLYYFKGRIAEILARALNVECPPGSQVGLPREGLVSYVQAEARGAADRCKRYGGVSLSQWWASDAEAVARQCPPEVRTMLQNVFLDEFRRSYRL